MIKKTWLERALDFIKGGDEAKMNRLHKAVIKKVDSNIKERNKQIAKNKEELAEEVDKLKDRIVDAKDLLNSVPVDVDVTKLTDSDGIDAYAQVLLSSTMMAILNVEDLESEIEKKQAACNKENKRLLEEINNFEKVKEMFE